MAKVVFCLLAAWWGCVGALLGEVPHTPAHGSAERKAICDALRVPVIKEFGVKPIFVIQTLNVLGDWAFLAGNLQREDGTPYNAEVLHRARKGDGRIFDGDSVYGLLRKEKGRWRAAACSVGPTDVSYLPWAREHGAPPILFDRRGRR